VSKTFQLYKIVIRFTCKTFFRYTLETHTQTHPFQNCVSLTFLLQDTKSSIAVVQGRP